MNAFAKTLFSVTLITGICTLILAIVSGATAGPIEAAKKKQTLDASRAVLPAGLAAPRLETIAGTDFYVSRKADGSLAGIAIEGRTEKGYSGLVTLMVGFTPDNRLHAYEVLQQTETPGLGVKIGDPAFKKQFAGRSLATLPWKVNKDGGDIDAITAATISSRAAIAAVADAAAKFAAYRAAHP